MYGAPSTLSKGRQAVKYILESRGALQGGTLHIDNGSGLSRSSKITAKLLADIYDHAYVRNGQRWMNTLSIAGVDGTIKRRFRGTVVRNRAWMKTGTLKRVKNIGGYVKSRNGRVYTAVIIVNSNRGNWKASQLQNNIIKWLVTYKGRGRIVAKTVPQKSLDSGKPQRRSVPVQKNENASYSIQVGSFSQTPDETYFSHIADLGMSYRIVKENGYKVFIGEYKSKEKAKMALKEVKNRINSGAFLVDNGSKTSGRPATLY